MSDGRRLLEFVKDIRKLCVQGAALLRAADKYMAQSGWRNAMKLNIAHAEGSSSLEQPEQWFPQEFARLYKHPERPSHIMFVALLLDDDVDGRFSLDEPIASGGWFELTSPLTTANYGTIYLTSRLHGYRTDMHNDGVVSPLVASDLALAKASISRAWTLGVPLVELTSSQQLADRLLQPLTAGFAAAVASP